jgi:hypothetical protein
MPFKKFATYKTFYLQLKKCLLFKTFFFNLVCICLNFNKLIHFNVNIIYINLETGLNQSCYN